MKIQTFHMPTAAEIKEDLITGLFEGIQFESADQRAELERALRASLTVSAPVLVSGGRKH